MPRRKDSDVFLDKLRNVQGRRSSNPALRDILKWSEKRYWKTHRNLFEAGLIEKGRGFGGTVYLVEDEQEVEELEGKEIEIEKIKERDLYKPVTELLKKNWNLRHNLDECHVEDIAHMGSKDTGGSWSRPDIGIVALKYYEYLPNKNMEIHTFEIKPDYDVTVKDVMEALTHRQFSTRSYVVYYTSGQEFSSFPESSRIESLAARHGIGVYAASSMDNFEGWDEVVPAVRTSPDPDEMELFIKRTLSDDTKSKILKWLK